MDLRSTQTQTEKPDAMNAIATTPSHQIDHARPFRQRLIRSCAPAASVVDRPDEGELSRLRIDASRCAAKLQLGTNWIIHPAYEFRPRHSFRIETWSAAPGVLDETITRARKAGRL